MLWSLLKVLIFIGIVAALSYGAEILLATGEGIRISALDMEFTLGPIQTVIATVVLFAAVWLVTKLVGLLVAVIRFIFGDETALTRYFSRSRERRGYRALSDALLALSSGETREAMSKAGKAEALLRKPELTTLIAAQAAEQSGDTSKAHEVYKRMLGNDKTRFAGIRGLMKQKLEAGDTDTAMKLAEKALALKPKNVETSDALFHMQAQNDDWVGARRTLGTKVKYGTLPRDVYRRRDAVLALSVANEKMESDPTEAEESALEANRLAPTFVPAAVAAARASIARKKPRNAVNALKTAWTHEPHPDLAVAFAEIVPDETPAERVERFGELTKINPDHPETKMLLAELNIAAENFPEARRAMGNLAETDPTKRSLTLMAAIERGEGSDDAVVKAWLAKAMTASPGPQWICEVDGKAYPAWQPMTEGGFDTLTWKEAPASEVISGSAAGMLPMIIGSGGEEKPAPETDPGIADSPPEEPDVVDGTATEAQAAGEKQPEKV